MALRDAPSDSTLLSSDELRVDALRGLLSAHRPRFRFHFRAKTCKMAHSDGLERTGTIFITLWNAKRIR